MSGYAIPVDYEGLNLYNSMRSVAGKVQNDINTQYYMRSLYQRAISGVTFTLPKDWNVRYFRNVLYFDGFIGIIKTAQFGIIPQMCGFTGYGLYRQPVTMLVNQPLVQFEGTIGENCELVMLTPDYRGIWDIIEHYAVRLSTAIASLDVSLINSRIPFVALPKNKSAAHTLRVVYEKISAGEPFVDLDRAVLKSEGINKDVDPIWTFSQNVKENYITDKILDDMDTILDQFDREIGIAAIGEKKERRVTGEIELESLDACARSRTWFECLTESFDNVNRLFPELDLSFRMNFGGESHEYGEKIKSDRRDDVPQDAV